MIEGNACLGAFAHAPQDEIPADFIAAADAAVAENASIEVHRNGERGVVVPVGDGAPRKTGLRDARLLR